MFTEIPQDLKEFCFLHSLQAEKFVGSTNISYFRVCFLAIQHPIPIQSFVSSLKWFIPTHVSSLDVTSKTTRDYSCVRVSLLPHHILYTVHNMTLVCIPNKKSLSKVQCSPTTFQRVFCQFFSFIPAICHDHSRDTYFSSYDSICLLLGKLNRFKLESCIERSLFGSFSHKKSKLAAMLAGHIFAHVIQEEALNSSLAKKYVLFERGY